MAKLNLRDISIAYTGATITSTVTGLTLGYLWQHIGGNTDYVLIVGASLLSVNIPSSIIAVETLRKRLGERQQTTVSAIGGGQSRARAIPFSSANGQSHVFMSVLNLIKPDPDPEPEIDLPTIFKVSVDNNSYSVTIDELESFLRCAWRRQKSGEAAFSRPYFTRQARPRLKPMEYYSRLSVLLSVEGLILDRSQRRSGRLACPPMTAIKALQGQFSLV